jgi:alpha-glucosidase
MDLQMDEAFPVYEKWGVAGLKVDFILRDDQHGINFYYRAAKKAAEHHLMLDFHGATKPSGLERTYPNVLGYEAVLGMENAKAGTRDNPDYHTMIPFTRMLAGPMDYTPGAFNNSTREEFMPRMESPMAMGTRAHQLAMYAVFQAAFQMVSDTPKAYEDQPEFDFIRNAPASWDEVRVLNGKPGGTSQLRAATEKSGSWEALTIGMRVNSTCRSISSARGITGLRFTPMRKTPTGIRSMFASIASRRIIVRICRLCSLRAADMPHDSYPCGSFYLHLSI